MSCQGLPLYKIACCAVMLSTIQPTDPNASVNVRPVSAQTSVATKPESEALTYETVSVKPHKSGDNRQWTRLLPDGYSAENISLRELIVQAYGFGTNPMTDQELAKQPSWFRSERFDIEARVDSEDVVALQKSMEYKGLTDEVAAMRNRIPTMRMLMLQELLADRFKMRVHHEAKEVPVYALVIAKNGPKLKESKLDDITKASIEGNDGEITVRGMPLIFVLRILAQELGRPVVDQTGLTGNYDFTLKWTGDQKQVLEGSSTGVTDTSGPSIFTAVQEQLGLKLEATKGFTDTIVVDHVEMPSKN
jgi:uncharacterized protein (TIGR03435 family)